jgi:hypothetical protein
VDPRLLPTTQAGKLDRLMEECSEVIKSICKARRFGWVATGLDGTVYDNRVDLLNELKDLNHAIAEVAADFPLEGTQDALLS